MSRVLIDTRHQPNHFIVIAGSSNFQIKFKCYDPLELLLLHSSHGLIRIEIKIAFILRNIMLHALCSVKCFIIITLTVDNDHLNFVSQLF